MARADSRSAVTRSSVTPEAFRQARAISQSGTCRAASAR